jgi:hypothetical protein
LLIRQGRRQPVRGQHRFDTGRTVSIRFLLIEYDEGYEEVYACQGDVGVSIGCRIPSSSEEAKSLRAELYAMGKRRRRIEVGDRTYELRCRTYDSFGEDAFEVKFRQV